MTLHFRRLDQYHKFTMTKRRSQELKLGGLQWVKKCSLNIVFCKHSYHVKIKSIKIFSTDFFSSSLYLSLNKFLTDCITSIGFSLDMKDRHSTSTFCVLMKSKLKAQNTQILLLSVGFSVTEKSN